MIHILHCITAIKSKPLKLFLPLTIAMSSVDTFIVTDHTQVVQDSSMKTKSLTTIYSPQVTDIKPGKKKRKRKTKLFMESDQSDLDKIDVQRETDVQCKTTKEQTNDFLKSHWLLQPNESVNLTIRFNPMTPGEFKRSLCLSTTNGNNYFLSMEGIADIPAINMSPDIMFKTVKSISLLIYLYIVCVIEEKILIAISSQVCQTKPRSWFEPAFITESSAVDFGYLLVSSSNKVYSQTTQIVLENISLVPAYVSISLVENSNSFSFEPRQVQIEVRI